MGIFDNNKYKSATSKKYGLILKVLLQKFFNYPSNENFNAIQNLLENKYVSKNDVKTIIEHDFKDYCFELAYHQDMTAENWNNFKVICNKLNITIPDKDLQRMFARYAYWCLDNFDKLPIPIGQNNDVLLKKNEVLYYSVPASIRKYKTSTKRIGYAGPSISIPIVKGVRYRVGSMKVGRQTETTLENVDTGYFYITNARVLFVGAKQNFAYSIDKLIKIGETDEGLLLHKENTANPKILGLPNYYLPLSILSAITNGTQITLFNDNDGIPPKDIGDAYIINQTANKNEIITNEKEIVATDTQMDEIKKKRIITYLLLLLPLPIIFTDPTHPYLPLGLLGLHRFYLKEYKMGALFLFTGSCFGFGFLYDLITSWKRIKLKVLNQE